MDSSDKASDNQASISSQSPTSKLGSGKDKSGDKNPDNITDLNLKSDLKFRENLYRLIISQLFYDGYQHIAVGLSGSVQVSFTSLFNLYKFYTLYKRMCVGVSAMSAV